MPKRILAIDTSTDACSVAIWNQGDILTLSEICSRDHTQRILPMVQQILESSDVALNQLDALAFGRGPGNFTGVRISIGITQGLALGADLPVIGVSTLQAMAQGEWRLSRSARVLTAIDARMAECYWGGFERLHDGNWKESEYETLLSPAHIMQRMSSLNGQWSCIGNGWQIYPDLLATPTVNTHIGQVLFPQAEDILPLALRAWQQGLAVSVEKANPIYLRNKIARKKLPHG